MGAPPQTNTASKSTYVLLGELAVHFIQHRTFDRGVESSPQPASLEPRSEYLVNTNRIRRWTWTSLLGVVALVAPQAAPLCAQESGGELKNVAVVAVAPWDKLTADVSYIGSLSGNPQLGQVMSGYFALFTQNKGPNAIDKQQAWGIIVQTDGAQFLPVACLPVTK